MPISAVREKIEMCGATPKGRDVLAGDRFQTSRICCHSEPASRIPLAILKERRLYCAVIRDHEKVEVSDPSRPPHGSNRLPRRGFAGSLASLEPFRLPLTIFKEGAFHDSIGAGYEEVEMV